MKTSARHLISGTAFFGFLSYLVYAVIFDGFASDAALIAFSLLTIQGIVEVAIASYAPGASSQPRVRIAAVPTPRTTDRPVAFPARAASRNSPPEEALAA